MMNEIKKKEAGHAFADRPKSREATADASKANAIENTWQYSWWLALSASTRALSCQDVPGTSLDKRAKCVQP
jgi:hypothetical protein